MNKKLYVSNQPRCDAGNSFAKKYDEPKILRSMKLTDYAWDTLQDQAQEKGVSRTDIVEDFTRSKPTNELMLEILERFIEAERLDHGSNPSQRGKEFNQSSRDWTKFNKLKALLEKAPWELT